MTYCVVCSNLPKANDGRRSFLLVCGKEIEHVSGVGPDNEDAPPSMSSEIASLAHLTSPWVSPAEPTYKQPCVCPSGRKKKLD